MLIQTKTQVTGPDVLHPSFQPLTVTCPEKPLAHRCGCGIFQLVILQQIPKNTLGMAFGLLIVAVGVALFLQGLELSIFPVGKSLSNQFARRGSIPILLAFGFAIGFSAVVAEGLMLLPFGCSWRCLLASWWDWESSEQLSAIPCTGS